MKRRSPSVRARRRRKRPNPPLVQNHPDGPPECGPLGCAAGAIPPAGVVEAAGHHLLTPFTICALRIWLPRFILNLRSLALPGSQRWSSFVVRYRARYCRRRSLIGQRRTASRIAAKISAMAGRERQTHQGRREAPSPVLEFAARSRNLWPCLCDWECKTQVSNRSSGTRARAPWTSPAWPLCASCVKAL